jgi:hypothetical protein
MKWPSPFTAAMCMELHFDYDHHTHVSRLGGDSAMLGSMYRDAFPGGAAVQPH